MRHIEILSTSSEQTMSLGSKIAQIIPNGTTILLCGDLGAGKTTLVRGLAHELGIKEVVQSPTFNIMKVYFKADRPLIHIDAYRLAENDVDIGLDEYIGFENGITVIEWPEFIEKLIPEQHIKISIFNKSLNERIIIVENNMDFSLEEIK